jgi:hypothetical protein
MRPPAALSYSRLRRLECPLSYYMQYMTPGFSYFQGVQALKGSLGHAIAAEYIPHLDRKRRRRDFDAYAEIIERHLQGYPRYIADAVRSVGEVFVGVFEWDRTAEQHQTEFLLVVDRDYKPTDEYRLDDEGHVHPTTKDICVGRIDYRFTKSAGRSATIWDLKMGEEHSHLDAAMQSWQGQIYCALDFWCNPQRERNIFRLWGVKYGRKNVSDWEYRQPDTACIPARERFELGFERLDALHLLTELGEPWPARDEAPETCKYCPVPGHCPFNQDTIAELMQRDIIVKPRKKRSA